MNYSQAVEYHATRFNVLEAFMENAGLVDDESANESSRIMLCTIMDIAKEYHKDPELVRKDVLARYAEMPQLVL